MNEILPAPESADAAPLTTQKHGSFAGDMLKLVSGSTGAQVITLLVTPILTRLFSPEAFGVGVAFASLITVISVFLCLRYEQAIVLPSERDHAINLSALSLLSGAAVTAVVTVVFMVWGPVIFGWLNMPEMDGYLWAIPVSLVIAAVTMVLQSWNTREHQFGRIGVNGVINSFVTQGSRVLSGLAGYTSGAAMVVTNMLGNLIAAIHYAALWTARDRASWRGRIRVVDMKDMARRYKELPLYGTWAALLNSISWQLPVFMLSAFFTPAVAGQYALGNRLIRVPMSIVGAALAQAFYPRAAEASNTTRLAPLVRGTFQRLVTFGMPIMLYLALAGRDLFAFFFGAQWAEAGIYVQILAAWSFFWFISSPMSTLYLVLGKQRWYLIWNIFNFGTRLLSLWIGGYYESPLLALALFGLSGVVVYGYMVLYLMQQSGVPWTESLRVLGVNLLAFLPVIAVWALLHWLNAPVWLQVIAPGAIVCGLLLRAFLKDPSLRAAVPLGRPSRG